MKPSTINKEIFCENCEACCCRFEVRIISETGIPAQFIAKDEWGVETMLRLADGWCAALDRNTLLCTIYEKRPSICRELDMGGHECQSIRESML